MSACDHIRTLGHLLTSIELPDAISTAVSARNWDALDQALKVETLPGGVIHEELGKYAEFTEIEFIISIRTSREEPDEDGIWHDDGSRLLAFSLSLSFDDREIQGGCLEIRKRQDPNAPLTILPTPPFGTMIVFATGLQGFEHRICRVSAGERIIAAGWCT